MFRGRRRAAPGSPPLALSCMASPRALAAALALAALAAPALAPAAAAQRPVPVLRWVHCAPPGKLAPGERWTDPSPHRCGALTVDGVRLHLLDWGGAGETVVLLHGLGGNPHTFDDLAPRLTDQFRVLALTRRGHAESDHPEGGYTIPRTSADALALLDALDVDRAHFVGHSLGGAEAAHLAAEHPERVLSVALLDGLPDWAEVERTEGRAEPRRPPPGEAFRALDTHRAWLRDVFYGFWSPALEADFRHSAFNPAATRALRDDAFAREPRYREIRAPALAVVATPTVRHAYPWLRPGDPAAAEDLRLGRAYLDSVFTPYQLARAERFRREAPDGRVVVLRGAHFVHNSNLDEVTHALRGFLAGDEPPALRLDHVPVAVRSLEAAVRSYGEGLGFRLKPGRPHRNGLRNTFAKLPDGSYLELITADSATDQLSRWYADLLRRGEGGARLALRADSLPALAERFRRDGYAGALRSYGGALRTLSFSAPALETIFLIEYLAPVVDDPALLRHPNTALGLEAVWLAPDAYRALRAVPSGFARTRAGAIPLAAGAISAAESGAAGAGSVVGVAIRVRSVDATREAVRAGTGELLPVHHDRGRRVRVPPRLAHGIWIEFVETPADARGTDIP